MSKKVPVIKLYLNKLKPYCGPAFTDDLEIFIANSSLDENGKIRLLDLVTSAYEIGIKRREKIKISG